MTRDTRVFGLIGYPLSHSFSPGYFAEKFLREGIADARYEAFPLANIQEFPDLLRREPNLCGLNVTIPYKQSVMAYLDAIDDDARAIGAVNTIHFGPNGRLTGYNTDWIGFLASIQPLLNHWAKGLSQQPTGALVLGTGGSSKAVHFALRKIGLQTRSVSRAHGSGVDYTYGELTAEVLRQYPVIINCTPLGMHPDVLSRPEIPYELISSEILLFDLVYNPAKTIFLTKGELAGAATGNGLAMLYGQAEAAWGIWEEAV
ncbi:MAG: shikimate dehydrogenase [Bacteroidetes bacterium]|nr:shikimate dehydrogenase [Bacteroidota bacterium]